MIILFRSSGMVTFPTFASFESKWNIYLTGIRIIQAM